MDALQFGIVWFSLCGSRWSCVLPSIVGRFYETAFLRGASFQLAILTGSQLGKLRHFQFSSLERGKSSHSIRVNNKSFARAVAGQRAANLAWGMKTRSRSLAQGVPVVVPGAIRTYAELQKQIHEDLRVQHPEWVGPNGDSPICNSYEQRLDELIRFFESLERKSLPA